MILLRTWHGIADHWPKRRHEWTMGVGALAMAVALTLQPYMFELAPHYQALRMWADEVVFADLFYLAGGLRLVALIVNGSFSSFRLTPHLRVFAASVGAFMFGAFSYSFFKAFAMTGGSGPGMETSLGPAIIYGIAAATEIVNVRTASMDVGTWAKGRG